MSLQECGTKTNYTQTHLCSHRHLHQEYHSLLVTLFPPTSQNTDAISPVLWLAECMSSSDLLESYSTSILSLSDIFPFFFFTATIPVHSQSYLYFIHFRNTQDIILTHLGMCNKCLMNK